MKKAFIISFVFISGLIGAGFATGSEIYYYFSQFGNAGIFGILLAVFLFSLTQYCVICQSAKHQTFVLDDYLKQIMPKPLAVFISLFSHIFMFFILAAMFSGFGEMLAELYGIKKIYGALIMLFFTYLIISKGHKSFILAESFMSIIIILVLAGVCLYILFAKNDVTTFNPDLSWAGSGISYAGYNMLTSTAVLCIIAEGADKKNSRKSAFITFFILCPLMCIIHYIIFMYSNIIPLGSMPLLKICLRHSNALSLIYAFAVFVSMLTTAVSSGYALFVRSDAILKSKFTLLIILATGFLLSGFDFSFIVDKLYRAAGFLSIILLFCIITKNRKK